MYMVSNECRQLFHVAFCFVNYERPKRMEMKCRETSKKRRIEDSRRQ